jgi:integrase/recombinase XerD
MKNLWYWFKNSGSHTQVIDYWKKLHMNEFWHKEVAENKQRKHNLAIAKLYLGKNTMAKQAKTLTQTELRRVLDYIATRKHSTRNRTLLLTTYLSGMRVGEISSLRFKDVVDAEGMIRNEIRLLAENTKTNEARTVFVNEKLRKELEAYAAIYTPKNINCKFFYSQKSTSDGFTANTLTQFFHYLYKRSGIDGASSHSGRRTFITNLASKGIGVRVLMSLAGHKNIGTTQCYIDCNDDMKRKAVELV